MNMIKELFKKYKLSESNDKRKIENLIFFLVMLVIVVIGINMILGKDNKVENNGENVKEFIENNISINTENEMEEKLSNILGKVKGVSNVNVMITYENNEQTYPIYNMKQGETTTKESDTNGGTREIVEKEYDKQVIFEEIGNEKSIAIEKINRPKVAGVIVVANFSNDLEIKQEIVKAVSSITNISEYKVQVLSSQ